MNPTERWHAIAPAPAESLQQRSAPDTKKKRQAIAVACLQCRSGKVKCDGLRPRCTRCIELDLECHFDVPEGVSRAERMKMLKKESLSSAEDMERIIHALRTTSDDQATALLAKLRIGTRLDVILRDLPPSIFSPSASRPSSSTAHESLGASESSASIDSNIPVGRSTTSSHESISRPLASSVRGKSSFSSPARPSSAIKQLTGSFDVTERPFLAILFDRNDFLRTISESESENDDDDVLDQAGYIDPRLLSHSSHGVPRTSTRSRTAAASKEPRGGSEAGTGRVYGLTHLSNRQPMVNTLRLHPNLNHGNLFGNFPFSSSVRTNNYPREVQDAQVDNLFVPTWAMMTVNTRSDPGSVKTAFQWLRQEVSTMIDSGVPTEAILETHPNIAALFDEDQYSKSGVLSRWAAGIVHSTYLKGSHFSAFASMYHVWYLARWMVSPSLETYEAMPVWMRPTPNQLFMPHTSILDFIIWPAFREFVVEIPEMHERMEYLLDMSHTIQCDWFFATEEALLKDDETGMFDLSDLAKTTMRDLSCWSVGSSLRQYVTNADSYVRIREETF